MPPIPSPPQLFRLFEQGELTREQLHAAMNLHARQLLEEIAEDRLHPVLAAIERKLSQQAAAKLIRRHGEPEMREVFRALAEVENFPPGTKLWNAGHPDVPLHCFLRTRRDPVFRVLRAEVSRLMITIAIEHGEVRGKRLIREEFVLRRAGSGRLTVSDRRPVSR